MKRPVVGPALISRAAADVLNERRRQQTVEGWTPEHDDEFAEQELARAAGCYARNPHKRFVGVPGEWPWDAEYWKPRDERRDLVRAAALLLAEIERIDRAADKALMQRLARREHTASADCWCGPTVEFEDPGTGACVLVHRGVQ